MSLVVDETAGDLPVRDVGLMRGGLMPTVPGLFPVHSNTCSCEYFHADSTLLLFSRYAA